MTETALAIIDLRKTKISDVAILQVMNTMDNQNIQVAKRVVLIEFNQLLEIIKLDLFCRIDIDPKGMYLFPVGSIYGMTILAQRNSL